MKPYAYFFKNSTKSNSFLFLKGERMNKIVTAIFVTLAALMIVLVIAIPVYFYFNVELPSQIAYGRALGSKVTMLYDAGGIYDFYNRTKELRIAMEAEFAGLDTTTVHADWRPWNQVPENTVAENIRWVGSFEERCKYNYEDMLAIKNGSKTILTPYGAWEQQTIEGMRNESKRAGGVVWATYGAWYQVHQPYCFWLHNALWYFGWFDLLWGLCLILAIIFGFLSLVTLGI